MTCSSQTVQSRSRRSGGSTATLAKSINAAQRSDTLIYTILFSDSTAHLPFGGPDGKSVLMRLAKETGASFFEVSRKRSIEQIYQEIQDELRSQYSLGFVSDRSNEISEFRTLKLTAKQQDLIVQCSGRYWAKA